MTKNRILILAFAVLLLTMAMAVTTSIMPKKVAYGQEQAANSQVKYNAKAAILKDFNTGEILFSQSENEKLPIASMVKIMTLNIIFEDIQNGKLKLDEQIQVSQNAASMGGSQAFLDAGSSYSADELIKSIIVASANDSCVALAEHLSGSVEDFVGRMNEKAASLGMQNTNFVNCTGLPAQNSYSTALDVGIMFKHLIGFEKFFDYAGVWMYDIQHPGGRTTTLTNTNKLVRFYNGCDGGKTGFTKEALSCLATTAKRGETRFVAVIVGAPEAKIRNAETSNLLNWGFSNFETRKIIDKNQVIEEILKVDSGKEESVGVLIKEDSFKLIKRGEKLEIETRVVLVESVKAPIKAGDIVGSIEAIRGDEVIAKVDLVASNDIEKAGYFDIINKMINKW
ncbi:MAG: D-alanyl-D-alanine carboxypeptidase [Firmicutes bacterium]|nr:D-alanyl-D-alanine carboxypeptidase [Bacillota bacterium]